VTATDNAGHAYASHLGNHGVGGISVCDRGSQCLKEAKEDTEEDATLIDSNSSATVTILFPFAPGQKDFGNVISIGLILHTRIAAFDGNQAVKWKTISVGLPSIPVRGR